jgi:transposase
MDTSKHFFQLHGVNAAEKVVLRKKLRRKEMEAFFEKLAPTIIGIEACGASHHWARLLQSFGHQVKLIAPQLAKPYVKRGKNDAADAAALCEAMSRPTMRFVPVKTAEQQAALKLVGLRDRLIRNCTQLSNAIRGYAAESGLTAAKGMAHLDPLLERIQADESLPNAARELFALQSKEYAQLQAQIDDVDAKLMAWHKADECSRRLAKIPGVGLIGAALLTMKSPAPQLFKSGRQFAAWIGLTPKDHSTAGKVRLGVITRAGDETLRSVLVVGATAVVQHVRRGGRGSPWILDLLKRKPPKLAAVALANKMARIAWKLMVTGESYAAKSASAALASAAERSARDGEQLNCNRAEPMPELARQRADGVIDRSKTRDTPLTPPAAKGRLSVWNPRRGNHLGQRSCASATTGRTYGRKRSDQNTAKTPLRGGGRPHMGSGCGAASH